MPLIIQIFLFGYTATFDLNHAPIAVLNESHGKYSQQLVAQVGASPTFYIRRYLQNASQMKDELNPRDSLAIVHIQSDFDSKLAQGKEGPVQIITDGRNSTTAGLAAAELSMIIQDFNHRYVGVPEGINVEMRAWYNPNLQTQWNIVTALIGTLSFIQVLMLSALSVAREREYGTFDQLLVSPYRPFEILLAKATPPIFIGIAQTFIVVLFAVFWFDIPMRGSLLPLYFRDFHFYVIDSRNRTGDFFHIADDAAGNDFLVCADCSNGYFVRSCHTGIQHAGNPAGSDICRSLEVCP